MRSGLFPASIFCGFAFSCLVAGPVFAVPMQYEGMPVTTKPSGNIPAIPSTPSEKQAAISKMMRGEVGKSSVDQVRLVESLSRLAGAEKFCHPHVDVSVRVCAEFIVAHWHDITGLEQEDSKRIKGYPVLWAHGMSLGYDIQSMGHGMSCEDVDKEIAKTGILSYCPVVRESINIRRNSR